MSESAGDPEVERILGVLKSGPAGEKLNVIPTIVRRRIEDVRIIDALHEIVAGEPNRYVRERAIQALRDLGYDPSADVQMASDRLFCPRCGHSNSRHRRTCKKCRAELPRVRAPARDPVKTRDFLIGLIGWYLINIPLWFILENSGVVESDQAFWLLAPLVLNVGFLIVATLKWPQIALGALAAIALPLVAALLLAVLIAAMCFVAV